jgi:hypothetical protein
MAKFRNVSGEARRVGYGTPVRIVEADETLTVQPGAAINYAGQSAIWSPADQAAQDAVDTYNAFHSERAQL